MSNADQLRNNKILIRRLELLPRLTVEQRLELEGLKKQNLVLQRLIEEAG